MEYHYPLFAGRRILKKESLWAVRDYTYAGWQLYYDGYTDGVLNGCGIRAEEETLVIEKGMIKFHDFIYLLQEEERVPCRPENAWRVLKAEFLAEEEGPDSRLYRVRFFLDEVLECGENQLELCRFYLREGSLLRDSYKSFSDMATEYDTINLLHAAAAGKGESTLHPAVLLRFAEELWAKEEKDGADIQFCFLIWNAKGKVERRVVVAYLEEKKIENYEMNYDNEKIYDCLCRAVVAVNRNNKEKFKKKLIIVE